MMDRWNITIETKLEKEENLAIPSHKVLKVSELSLIIIRKKCHRINFVLSQISSIIVV